jgi:hypothetical protein
MSNH